MVNKNSNRSKVNRKTITENKVEDAVEQTEDLLAGEPDHPVHEPNSEGVVPTRPVEVEAKEEEPVDTRPSHQTNAEPSTDHKAKGEKHPMAKATRPPGFQFVKHEEFVVVRPFVEGSTPMQVGEDYDNPKRLHRLYRRRRIMPKGFACTDERLEAYRIAQEQAEKNEADRKDRLDKKAKYEAGRAEELAEAAKVNELTQDTLPVKVDTPQNEE